jgi:hypothetical protein
MKKFLIWLLIACLIGCVTVSAQNISRTEDIALGETKIITIPKPDGEVDEGTVYFQQEFLFIPEESGTYRMLMSYKEDEANPYDVFLDIPGHYLQLDNGIEFEAIAGETYQLCFQYPNHDGRYPTITFHLGTDVEEIPKTFDRCLLLPGLCLVLSALLLVTAKKKYTAI